MIGLRHVPSDRVHVWVAAYDIADSNRRSHVAKILLGCGERVQCSVFECRLGDNELKNIRARVCAVLDPGEDQIRWYPMCGPCSERVACQGTARIIENEGYYVI